MQTHIVVPLDGSSLAETILPHASALARAFSAKVTLLRVIPPVTSLGLMGVELPEHWFDEEMAWSQNYLADVARQLTDEGGIHVQTEVLDGDPATEIVTYTQQKHDVSPPHPLRSEEHTSELQSHHDLVCRLLLEKKKQAIEKGAERMGDGYHGSVADDGERASHLFPPLGRQRVAPCSARVIDAGVHCGRLRLNVV